MRADFVKCLISLTGTFRSLLDLSAFAEAKTCRIAFKQKPGNSVADPYVSLLARLQRRVGVCSRLPMPQHKENAIARVPDGGSIILNASITASKGIANLSVYSATKAAVRSFAHTWTVDLKDRRIRVNALSPGYIDTAPWRSDRVAEIRANIMSSGTVPSGRFGTSDEVAKVAVFLANDDSSYVTGTELFVDGGVAQI